MTHYVGWLRGCGTALVTPFTATGAVDEKRFRALVERQIAAGGRLLVPCGTTREAATLTAPEHERLIALTGETARGRAKGLARAGSKATPPPNGPGPAGPAARGGAPPLPGPL